MSTEIYCIHCGRKNLPEARFCQFCGKPIPQSTEQMVAIGKNEKLECPYCGQQISPTPDVTQLVCIQCAAAFEVHREGDNLELVILRNR